MTVQVADRLSQLYVGNGVNKRFDFTFRVFNQENETGIGVRVQVGSDFVFMDDALYDVTLNEDNVGGYITFVQAPDASSYFYISGKTPVDQALDITNYDNFYPDALERALDKLTAILQEWKHLVDFEAKTRILADISYDELAQSREADLKAYIDGVVSAVVGHPVSGFPAEFVVDDDKNQREINMEQALLNASLKKNGALKQQYQYTLMGKAFSSIDGVNDNAAMWPHANIKYDATTDNFIILYNTNAGHDISRNSVLFRTKPSNADAFSNPVIVASDKNNYSYKCQGSGIAANGDYVAIVAQFPWGSATSNATWIYRSTTKGATWSRTQMLDASNGNAAILAFNGDASGFLLTQSGRILTFANHPTTVETRIYYSDDNGATWRKSTIAGNPTDVTEPAWCDLGGGKLICYARAAVRFGALSEIIPAKIMRSTDNGLNWSAPVDSVSIPNMTLANGELLPDHDKEIVEFVFHSRYTDADNYCSLYRSCGTFDDCYNDTMQAQERIGKMVAYTSYLNTTGDSGYVGAAKDSKGNIFGMFYTGQRTGTTGLSQLSYFVAGLSKIAEKGLIDYRSGEVAEYSNVAGSSTESSVAMYSAGVEKLGTLGTGMTQSATYGTGGWVKNASTLSISMTSAANQFYRNSLVLSDNVSLKDVDFIEITVDSLTKSNLADVAISIYDGVADPLNPATNRVGIFAAPTAGVFRHNVSNLSNMGCSIHLVGTITQSTSAETLSAVVSKIDFKSIKLSSKDLSASMVAHKSKVFSGDYRLAGISGISTIASYQGTGTQAVAKENGSIKLSNTLATGATYSSVVLFNKAIPRKATGVRCKAISNNTTADFGLAVFNSTTVSIPNRIHSKFSSKNSEIFMPITSALVQSQDCYLGLILNNTAAVEKTVNFDDIEYTFD